jgi:hypothetical protein
MRLSHLGKVFTTVMAEIRLLNSSCCRAGDLKCCVTGPKIIVKCTRSASMLDFLQHLLAFVVNCTGSTVLKDHTSWQMFMPLPANSLMQSARLVTAYVHMRTPAAQHTDATAFKHTGTLYILWLWIKMDVSTASEFILSKMVNPCLKASPRIQGTHLFSL